MNTSYAWLLCEPVDLIAHPSLIASFANVTYLIRDMATCSTLIVMCCSSAPLTSRLTLEFGREFARLGVKPPTIVRGEAVDKVRKQAMKALAEGEAGAGSAGKFALIRQVSTRSRSLDLGLRY